MNGCSASSLIYRELGVRAPVDGECYDSAPDVQLARQLRIRRIHHLLVRADVGEDPPDDADCRPAWF